MNQPSTIPRHTQHRDRREAAATPHILPDPHENCAKRKARQRVKRNESALVTFCTGHERKDINPQGHQWRLQTLYRRWLCTVLCACPRSMSTATISNLRTTRDSLVIAPAKAPSEKSLKTGARSCGRSAWIRWAKIPAVSYPRKSSTKFLHGATPRQLGLSTEPLRSFLRNLPW